MQTSQLQNVQISSYVSPILYFNGENLQHNLFAAMYPSFNWSIQYIANYSVCILYEYSKIY